MDEKYKASFAQTLEPTGLDASSGEVAVLLQADPLQGVVGLGNMRLVRRRFDGSA